MTTPNPITMIAPDGSIAEVAPQGIALAMSKGAKPAINMRAPDGSEAWVPHDQLGPAMRAGAVIKSQAVDQSKPTQFEQQRPGGAMSFGQQLMDFLKTTGGNLVPNGGPPTPYSTMGAVNPAPFQQMQQNQAQALDQQRQFRKDQGYSPAYRALAEVAPLAMVNPAGAEQAAAQGRTGAVLGNTVGPPVAMAVAAKAIPAAAKAINELGPTPKESLIAAIKPTAKVAPKLSAAIDTAMPDLKNIAATDAPSELGDLHTSLQKASLGYESQFQNLLKPNENVAVSTDPIADRIQSVINKRPEQAAALQPLVDKYRGQTMTLGELNARRPDVSGVESSGIRDVLYGELDRLNPTANVSGLKQSQSAVLTIQNALKDRLASLITPEATVNARPLAQRLTNAAVSAHITRPATVPLALWRAMRPKLPTDIPNAQVGNAMNKLNQ